MKSAAFLVCMICCLSLKGQSGEKVVCHPRPIPLMILGDSHMVGYWGEYFHRKLHETGRFNILNLAIGGAGSRHFIQKKLTNHCCGYKIRRTWVGDVFEAEDHVRRIEMSAVGDKSGVGAEWNYRLDSMVAYWQPEIVLIALGSNRIDAHEDLIELIRGACPKARIVWLSPFNRMGFEVRLNSIERCIKGKSYCTLVRMDDLAGHDTLLTFHLGSYSARKVGLKSAERVLPLLIDGVNHN